MNNVFIGLARIRDIYELYDFRLVSEEEFTDGFGKNTGVSNLDKNINKYRKITFEKISCKEYNFLIIPFNRQFGVKSKPSELKKIIDDIKNYKGEDVLLNYINENFKYEKVIKSMMPFKEGVVIFKRKV